MNQEEKKAASLLLARMAGILDVAEEVTERILAEVLESQNRSEAKTANVLGDLIKLLQLLEKQYSFLRAVEKEQAAAQELPQPDEEAIRNYLNEKHEKMTRAEKTLLKGKQKHV